MKIDKLLVFVSIVSVILLFIYFSDTPTANEAAIQRASLLEDVTTGQQIVNAKMAFFILIPVGAAYFLFTKSKTKFGKEIWENVGGKIGLVAGFLSIFVLMHQIPFYLATIALMTSLGLYLRNRFGINWLTAFLIPFIPAYYYMFTQIFTKYGGFTGITFFNAATLAVYIWVIPILGALVMYALYKKYIPFPKQKLI